MDWKKEEKNFNGIFKPKFCFFFFEIFKEKKRRKKQQVTRHFSRGTSSRSKEGRKQRGYIYVCALCAVYSIPTQSHRVWWHAHHLSSLSRRRLEAAFFSGAATKAQSTRTSWSSINFPSMFSIARNASSFSLYSIRQYPFTNPVRRSKFKCTFEISPKSPKFS